MCAFIVIRKYIFYSTRFVCRALRKWWQRNTAVCDDEETNHIPKRYILYSIVAQCALKCVRVFARTNLHSIPPRGVRVDAEWVRLGRNLLGWCARTTNRCAVASTKAHYSEISLCVAFSLSQYIFLCGFFSEFTANQLNLGLGGANGINFHTHARMYII